MRKSNFALRLQPSLLDEARKLAEAEGVTTGDVSKERLAEVRARLPLLVQRRTAAGVTTPS